MIKKIILGLIFLMPTLSFAQGGGFVGRIFKHHNEQRQQMQQDEVYKYAVMSGVEAESIYLNLVMNVGLPVIDLSESCSRPVKTVILHNGRGEYTQCFDRGETFDFGPRYKCYVRKELRNNLVNEIWPILFKADTIPACGGGRIHPRRVQ